MSVGGQLVFSLPFILTWTLTTEWHLPPSLTYPRNNFLGTPRHLS